MRVLFDALGAPAESGGMRLHATQIVSTWAREFPSDSLHVIGPGWITEERGFASTMTHTWPNESVLTRAPGQLLASAFVARRHAVDAVVSLSPVVTPLSGRPALNFQHDWRHIKNPGEFGRAQRLYRQLWRFSSGWSSLNICISEKARAETLAVSPSAATSVIANGYDDAAGWPSRGTDAEAGQITTFGHHNNKRPELLIESLPLIRKSVDANLIVLGAKGTYKDSLEGLARQHGVARHVKFPGFVAQDEYERIVASSALIALVSSDEGFGLPIAEAACLGIPALITSDSGMDEIFGEYPVVADPSTASIAKAVVAALTTPPSTSPTLTTTLPQTWSSAVHGLRSEVRNVLASGAA